MVTGVVAARALGVTGRGDFALLAVAPVTVVILGGLGLPQATAYFTAQAGSVSARLSIIRTAIRIAVPVSLLLTGLYVMAVLILTVDDREMRIPALISSGLVLLIFGQSLGIAILQGMRDFDLYNLFRVMPLVIYAPLSALVFALGAATLINLISLFVASFAVATVLTWLALSGSNTQGEHRNPLFPKKILILFGIRGLMGDGHPSDQIRLDQLVVGLLVNARELGLYASGASFSNLSGFVAKSIGAVAFPRIASITQENLQWKIATRGLIIGGAGILLVTGVLEALLPLLVKLFFGEAFLGAVPIGRILLVAGALLALKRLLTDIARGLGHPGYGSIAEAAYILTFGATVSVLALTDSLTAQTVAGAVTLGGLASLAFFAISLVQLKARHTG